ncbi:MAG: hypothetical protein M3P12_12035 [Gemmatimonadota bacterium]|nr:hypothetical protein [Gemmatimonadota bacterium]
MSLRITQARRAISEEYSQRVARHGKYPDRLGDYLSVRKMALVGNEPRTISPDSATVLTIKVLFAQPGLPIGEQGSRGRAQLLGTSFAQYERAFREQMADLFAPGGFDPRPDIAGIILNRWGHAYVNPQPGSSLASTASPRRSRTDPVIYRHACTVTATQRYNVGTYRIEAVRPRVKQEE